METVTESTVVDFEKFKEIKFSLQRLSELELQLGYIAYDGINFLKNKFNLQYFMSSPVDLYKGREITALSSKTDAFEKILLRFKNEIENDNEIFLYDLRYICSRPIFNIIDQKTFTPIMLDFPIMSEGFWLIRYGILNKTLMG